MILDDCMLIFRPIFYPKGFGKPGKKKNDYEITKNVNVYKLRNNKRPPFFLGKGLPVLRNELDFEPHIYCTKRINSKIYTRNWIKKNNFPMKPIYQMYNQHGNKADMELKVRNVMFLR